MILTTRPVLLFVFKYYVRLLRSDMPSSERASPGAKPSPVPGPGPGPGKAPSPVTTALSEACIYAARASNRLLRQLWIDGAIATFGYFDASYIFSSTLVLLMAHILNPNDTDQSSIDLAVQLLQSMAHDGNLPAGELCERLASLRAELAALAAQVRRDPHRRGPARGYITSAGTFAAHVAPRGSAHETGSPSGPSGVGTWQANAPPTTASAPAAASPVGSTLTHGSSGWGSAPLLEDPFFKDFLGQPYSELSPSAFGITNDEMGISSLAWDINTFTSI